jgi:CheY-like chemotaxis protein
MSVSLHGQPRGLAPVPLKALRVLIVEDQAIIALDLEARIRDLGHEVVSIVHTGQAAIEAVAKCHPDLVLINVALSDGAVGVDAAKLIRERFGTASIFITAHTNSEVTEHIAQAEPIDVLVKPIFDPALQTALLRTSMKLCATHLT